MHHRIKNARCRNVQPNVQLSLCVLFYFIKRGDFVIKINGKEVPKAKGMTVKNYLASNNYKLTFVAVELNGNILPKSEYESYVISENDTLEIVSFVGGG